MTWPQHLREECKQAEEHLSRTYQRNAPVANSRPYDNKGQVQAVYFEDEVEEEQRDDECVEELQSNAIWRNVLSVTK